METLVDKDAVEGNLRLMANCFGVVHGGVGVLLVYATSLFSERCGSMGNGFFFAMTLPGSLLLAVPLLSLLGRKGCLLYSFCSYVVYAILFCVARAMQHGDQEHERCDQAGPVLLCIGSSLAGLAAGVMWTGQGSYFAYAAKLLSTGSDDEAHRQQATSWLAGVFAVRYLGWELSLKLFVSLVQYFGQVNLSIIALIAMATLATVVFAACDNLPKEVQKDPPGQMLGKLRSVKAPRAERSRRLDCQALALWPDATIWLLSPTNLAFGFGSAYMNGYFNSEIAAKIVGVDTIGALASVTVVTAAMASMGYSFLAKRGKALPLALGSLAMVATMIFGFTERTSHMGVGLVFVPYMLWGFGRGSYESVNRAALADFYKSSKTEAAFANYTFQQCTAASIAFFVNQAKLSVTATTITALLVWPCYCAAHWLCAPDPERRYLMEAEPTTVSARQISF
ncbi:unnamed protein product [Effrenium voratum]|nr:unnamed protein product [Effrenium voratum]